MNYPAGISSLPCPWNRANEEDFGHEWCWVCDARMEFTDEHQDIYIDERLEDEAPVQFVDGKIICAGCAEAE